MAHDGCYNVTLICCWLSKLVAECMMKVNTGEWGERPISPCDCSLPSVLLGASHACKEVIPDVISPLPSSSTKLPFPFHSSTLKASWCAARRRKEETLQCKMRTYSSRCRCLAGNSTRLGCRPCTLLADPQLTGYISAGTESLQELVWLGLRLELELALAGRLQMGQGSSASPKSCPPKASFLDQVLQSSLSRRRLPGIHSLSGQRGRRRGLRTGSGQTRSEQHRLRCCSLFTSRSPKWKLLRALPSAELQSRDLLRTLTRARRRKGSWKWLAKQGLKSLLVCSKALQRKPDKSPCGCLRSEVVRLTAVRESLTQG